MSNKNVVVKCALCGEPMPAGHSSNCPTTIKLTVPEPPPPADTGGSDVFQKTNQHREQRK